MVTALPQYINGQIDAPLREFKRGTARKHSQISRRRAGFRQEGQIIVYYGQQVLW